MDSLGGENPEGFVRTDGAKRRSTASESTAKIVIEGKASSASEIKIRTSLPRSRAPAWRSYRLNHRLGQGLFQMVKNVH